MNIANNEGRGSGRSIRTLFYSLSLPNKNIVLVFSNVSVTLYHFNSFIDILTDLNFDHKVIKSSRKIENANRIFHFFSDTQDYQQRIRGLSDYIIVYDHEV